MGRRKARLRKWHKSRQPSSRRLGRDTAIIWVAVVLTWGYTAWAVYSHFVRNVHVHIFCWLLLFDVVLLPLAIWMTVEWRRSRD